jgi:outer membrane receptor protein involved in Fe transport
MRTLLLGAVACLVVSSSVAAQDEQTSGVDTIIVTAPGGAIDLDDALALDRRDLSLAGTPDLLGALTRKFAGVTLQDAQNNPWQPNLVYRGYVASPLQGQAQGLAVYLDGARFNQAFGDTVNFDFLPDAAINSVTLRDANPVYGLNALGGALVVETATGRAVQGIEGTAALGAYGERDLGLSVGDAIGGFSYFSAIQYREEDGWRDYSPSDLLNGFVDLGYDGARAGVHIKFIGADTDLTGNGVAPVELLAARRQSVFTWPDNTRNRYGRLSLHPWFTVADGVRFEATLYRQRLNAATINGDAADIEECADHDLEGLLCLQAVGSDDELTLTDMDGNVVADVLDGGDYGVFNRGNIITRTNGILAQFVADHDLEGRTNRLALGFSYDASESNFATSTELGELTDDRSVAGLGVSIDQADGSIAPVGLETLTRYWSGFLSDTLPIGETLSAEIGLRYNYAQVRLFDQLGTALNGNHSFESLNPGIEMDWAATPDISLRVGYAETNRVPTAAELSCADENAPCSLTNFFVADPPLEQVSAKSFELGAAGNAMRGPWTISWLLSGYRTRNVNDIQYIASEIRGRAYFQNIGKTRRQGLEATLSARNGGWQLAASYAFTDASYRTPIVLSSPANPMADEEGLIAVSRGDRLPGLPRHSATLSGDYAGALGTHSFTVGGDIALRSSQILIGDEANLNENVSGYVLVNLRGSVDLVEGLSLFGEVRNALDRKYATFGTFSEVDEIELDEVPGASDPRAYGPGSPLRWTLGVRAQF